MDKYDVIVCIDYKLGGSRWVLAHRDLDGAPLPRPGQRGELYTFRVSGVPVSLRESAVADLILGLVNDLGGRPGVDYKVAYNVTWDALCAGGLVSGEGNVSLEEIQALHGYTKYTLSFLLGKGQLAASRPPQMKGGHRPVIINKADLDYYLSHKKAKGRPLKKES